MPFKSESQRKKFGALVREGKMDQATFDKWNEETGDKKLPEKVDYKPKGLVRKPRRTR